ncbi:MXAN_6652 family MXYO-CTERM-anchored protein [Hyalangium versicolor]|uniref:MXAN_6652 family MXYO-CTERM-anchored protein n=1 Tax=Hyalangium versicolor TaxID=2861190 RepID=UPI001CCD0543|nr:MXAN_6652 family MXYO-CTERM-anchored protein [Hyalangium versicolor]
MHPLIRIAGVFTVSALWSSPAFATSTGITGQSGKDGMSCATCHKGGEPPTVEFEGPASLDPGATGQYTFIIRGGAAKTGGLDIAVDNTDATLQTVSTGMKKLGAELTHSAPQPFNAGELRFNFSLVAPATDVTLTIFGAGNSTNADLKSDGDRSSTTKLSVKVGKGTPVDVPNEEGPKESDGGCAAAGSAPVWGAMLAGLALLRRRQG